MIVVPLEPGEILIPKPGMWTNYKELKLHSSREFKGLTYWWLETTAKHGATSLETLAENLLRSGWVRKPKPKPDFFQVGKTYKFLSGGSPCVIKVLGVYGASTPKAVARVTDPYGGDDILLFSRGDLNRMVEVTVEEFEE